MAVSTLTATAVMARIAENHYASYVEAALKKAKYREFDMTMRQVRDALKVFPGLKPVLDTFFFNDGSEKQLLSLSGTVSIFYKGEHYNIPIIIWLLDKHPFKTPKIFLQPTNEMRIKTSHCVDRNGRVYLPWQKMWNPVMSNIRTMIYDIIEMFEYKPPLYSIS